MATTGRRSIFLTQRPSADIDIPANGSIGKMYRPAMPNTAGSPTLVQVMYWAKEMPAAHYRAAMIGKKFFFLDKLLGSRAATRKEAAISSAPAYTAELGRGASSHPKSPIMV